MGVAVEMEPLVYVEEKNSKSEKDNLLKSFMITTLLELRINIPRTMCLTWLG